MVMYRTSAIIAGMNVFKIRCLHYLILSSICFLFTLAEIRYNMPEFVSSSNLAQEKDILEGKRQYEMIQKKSENPKYGDCWKQAVINLQSGCKHLSEHVQSRLAIHFASCFLEQSGQKSFNCSDKNDIRECLMNVDSNAFASYLEFFTHTQSICLFLQSQVWQENTDLTIAKLSESSVTAAEKLEKANKNQDQILQLQHQSINSQQKLLEYGENLENVLEKSKTQVSEMLREFRAATEEQRTIVLEVFDRVSKLQSLIIGEFAGFYTLIFFTLAMMVSFILTSTSRTSSARLWLFTVIVINALLERLILYYWAEEERIQPTLLSNEGPVYQKVWLCRKMTCILGIAILTVQVCRYKDYNKLNNQLLKQIHEQNLQLKLHLERIGEISPRSGSSVVISEIQTETLNEVTEELNIQSQSDSNLLDPSSCLSSFSHLVTSSGDTIARELSQELDSGVDEEVLGENFMQKAPVPKRRKERRGSTSSRDSFTHRYNLRRRSPTPFLISSHSSADVSTPVVSTSSREIKTSSKNLNYKEIQEAVCVRTSFYSDDDDA